MKTIILVMVASSSTQLSVFAVLEILQESKPCRQASICHLGSTPMLLFGAKIEEMLSKSLKQDMFYYMASHVNRQNCSLLEI